MPYYVDLSPDNAFSFLMPNATFDLVLLALLRIFQGRLSLELAGAPTRAR